MVADFSPALSEPAIAQAAAAFAADQHVRIPAILSVDAAQALYDWLVREAEWWRAITQGDQVYDLGPESIAALAADPAKDAALKTALHAHARDGFAFLFDTVRISDDPAARRARQSPIDALLEALNTPEWIALFRRITGCDAIAFADGQATRYLPGHFLTAHDDAVAGKNRHAAYVLGLTPRWRTEWGGLLTFHDDNGDVARALLPRFNSLYLFAVPRWHSVSPVSAFAGAPRYSITGWLRHSG